MEIFIGNLADAATPADLQRLFAGYGRCSGFLLVADRIGGRTAYGVIEPDGEARRAIRELNGRALAGRPITVAEHVGPVQGEAARAGRPWVIAAQANGERRRGDRRQADRRQGERRVADRRSLTRQPASRTEEAEEQRMGQRRVGERRRGERRGTERRGEP